MKAKGFNTKTRSIENMWDAGIMNPTRIEYNAVKNAISVASTVITAPTLVTLPRMEEKPAEPPVEPVVR